MIPFSPPRIDEKTVKEVTEALLSGWITTGPKTQLFENKLAEYIGVNHVVCLNSATAGLKLILNWLDIKEGDEVIIPAYTYCATANVVVQTGAKPIMVDVNSTDFNINLDAIEKAISNKTKAIIAVDIAGFPADYDEIINLISKKEIVSQFKPENNNQKGIGRIALISDAAHSIGAIYKNQRTGNQADMSSFSFHAVKNLTTAEGGAVAFNLNNSYDEEKLKQYFKTLSLHGQSKDALAKTKAGGWKYDVIEAGFKCNMTDIHAAIGLIELERYQETLKRREEIFKLYDKFFSIKNWANLPTYESKHKKTSYHLYMLRINNCSENERDQIIQHVSNMQIAVNVHYIPLPMLSFYKNMGYNIEEYPNSYKNYTCEISLPVYFNLTDDQVFEVANAIENAVDSVLK
jgi:dTDP-4-amino-4,6-dideoxygalactose transaminase